jgi:hypothetical protein
VSAAPTPTITLFLGVPFDGGNLFTIEDPVNGRIETGGVIAGDIGTDFSAEAYDIQISRGRSFELDSNGAGTANIAFRNYHRDWDPMNTSSPYHGLFTPGGEAHVSIYGQRIYTGYIDDWMNTYSLAGEAVGSFPCIDGLGIMARQEFDLWTTTAGQTAGPRITSILNRTEVAWPGGARSIDTGVTPLQGDNVTWGSNVLNYIQLVALSDFGNAFVDRNGVFTFNDREALAEPTATLTFADNGTGIPFADAPLTAAGYRFRTQVSVDGSGTKQTASAVTVGSSSAIRRTSLPGLLMSADSDALALAQWLLSIYSAPIPRVQMITVNFAALPDDATRAQVAALDIDSIVHVHRTPLGIGSTIDEDYSILGLTHSIPVDGPHTATYTLAPITQTSLFAIEDATNGVIEGPGRIAF